MKEMLSGVQGQRPETLDRRFLAFGKGDDIGALAVELTALAVVIRVEVLDFL